MIKNLPAGVILSVFFLTGFSAPTPSGHPNDSELYGIRTGLQIPNHGPVVKIIQPQKNSSYSWDDPVPYAVDVSDKEDGDSKYQEIPSTEVLVKLKYLENAARASVYMKQKKFSDTTGIISMLVSNCFSCHAVKTKLAGPSFQDIGKRYRNTVTNSRELVNHIKKGSTGVWGKEAMPTHPELSDTVTWQMVKWILTYSTDPTLNYFVGLEGTLALNRPGIISNTGIFALSAYYLDHGTTECPNKRMIGSDWLTFRVLSKSAK
jgi:cytochrome c